ncbi:unnamed protein product [Clavelina lepadiformis]|uniref:Uncharacterized protein n=1 Tax=Clavelina lepadiformis TaxID=159417 RepID=A0ABP0GIN5_CLALP
MEYHSDNIQVDFLLKAISDMISQQFISMRQDMKIEFAKVQENMEDMVSKILAETKKSETINNAIPFKQTSQPLESDAGICIKEVYSQNASVLPLVEAIKEEPLLLQHWEVSEKDEQRMFMSNKFSHQSEIGVNAVVQTVKPQTCIEEDHSEKASVYPQFEVIEDEPLLLQKYEVSQTEIDDSNISMLKKFPPQSEIGVKATFKMLDARNCIERSSDEECSNSVEMFFDKSATNDRNNACKIQTQLFVGNNKEKQNKEDMVSRLFVETKKIEAINNAMPIKETLQPMIAKSSISPNNDEVYSEEASILPLIEAIKEEPLLFEEYLFSRTKTDEPNISMLDTSLLQSKVGANATVTFFEPQSCVETNSDQECSNSVQIFLDKPTASDGINAYKVDAQTLRQFFLSLKLSKKNLSCCSIGMFLKLIDQVYPFQKCFLNNRSNLISASTVMECHPDSVQVGVLLKAISDMISQDFKSMRLDMEMEETKETETMNNAMSHQRNITTISVRSQVCVFPRLPLRL